MRKYNILMTIGVHATLMTNIKIDGCISALMLAIHGLCRNKIPKFISVQVVRCVITYFRTFSDTTAAG